jgi:hypothetical protein
MASRPCSGTTRQAARTWGAAYLIGADGGRVVRRRIGVDYEGLGMITQPATSYVSATSSGARRVPTC